jgi:CsoR family transcriptional regulator, copper-sensing transcriptional repressor
MLGRTLTMRTGAAVDERTTDGQNDHSDHSSPTTPGYAEHKEAHLKRLRRIEGQVRGIERMVEDDRYCIDILTQVSAATSALQSAALALLEEHLEHCVADAVRAGGAEADAKVAEASAAIARLVRS